MTQIAEKAVLLHSELGIRTGLPRCSPTYIQRIKSGIKTTDTDNSAILAGSWMLDRLPVIALSVVRISIQLNLRVNKTHAKT